MTVYEAKMKSQKIQIERFSMNLKIESFNSHQSPNLSSFSSRARWWGRDAKRKIHDEMLHVNFDEIFIIGVPHR